MGSRVVLSALPPVWAVVEVYERSERVGGSWEACAVPAGADAAVPRAQFWSDAGPLRPLPAQDGWLARVLCAGP